MYFNHSDGSKFIRREVFYNRCLSLPPLPPAPNYIFPRVHRRLLGRIHTTSRGVACLWSEASALIIHSRLQCARKSQGLGQAARRPVSADWQPVTVPAGAHSLLALSSSSLDPGPRPVGREGQGSPFPAQLTTMASRYHFIFIGSFTPHSNYTSTVTILQVSQLRTSQGRGRIRTKFKQPSSRAQAITNSILQMGKRRPQKVEPCGAILHAVRSSRARTCICDFWG